MEKKEKIKVPFKTSSQQKDMLYTLSLIENHGAKGPVPVTQLYKMVQSIRPYEAHSNNFRASIHTLAKHGHVKTSHVRCRLYVEMLPSGRKIAYSQMKLRVNS